MLIRNRETDVLRAVNRLGPDCTARQVRVRLDEAGSGGWLSAPVAWTLRVLRGKGQVSSRPAGRLGLLHSITRAGSERLASEMRDFIYRDGSGRGGRLVPVAVPARRR